MMSCIRRSCFVRAGGFAVSSARAVGDSKKRAPAEHELQEALAAAAVAWAAADRGAAATTADRADEEAALHVTERALRDALTARRRTERGLAFTDGWVAAATRASAQGAADAERA